jgi:hypothetical protein
MPKIDKIKLQQAVDTVKIFRERWLEWTQYDPIEKNAMALDTLLQSAQAVLSGEVFMGRTEIEKVIGKVADECMYDFPKAYTNAQIVAFQKGVDKMWSKTGDNLTRIPKPLSVSEIEKIICNSEFWKNYWSLHWSTYNTDPASEETKDLATAIVNAYNAMGGER